jgi:tetraacyldisaccharide 4'-kinase
VSVARPWLAPLTPLYRLALSLRELGLRGGLEPVRRLRLPVISIGNLSTGGAGKTPLAITLARALAERGLHVDVLSRGYGRKSCGAMCVILNGAAEEFGDEPLEIAQGAGVPVYVAAQRYEAGLLAEADAPSGVHLLDDGFQHRQLHRDLEILLLSGADLEDRLLPAGNLREPIHALRRASVIAIPGEEPELAGELTRHGWQGPVWRLRRRIEVPPVDGGVLAFCGIARSEQFFAGLESAGLDVVKRIAFRDHHSYIPDDLARLQREARKAGAAALVTTEKDRIRMGRFAEASAESLPIRFAALRVEIENEDTAIEWLMSRVAPVEAR